MPTPINELLQFLAGSIGHRKTDALIVGSRLDAVSYVRTLNEIVTEQVGFLLQNRDFSRLADAGALSRFQKTLATGTNALKAGRAVKLPLHRLSSGQRKALDLIMANGLLSHPELTIEGKQGILEVLREPVTKALKQADKGKSQSLKVLAGLTRGTAGQLALPLTSGATEGASSTAKAAASIPPEQLVGALNKAQGSRVRAPARITDQLVSALSKARGSLARPAAGATAAVAGGSVAGEAAASAGPNVAAAEAAGEIFAVGAGAGGAGAGRTIRPGLPGLFDRLMRGKDQLKDFAKTPKGGRLLKTTGAGLGLAVLSEVLVKQLARFSRTSPEQNPALIDPQALLNQRLTAQNRQRDLFELLLQNPEMLTKLQQAAAPPTPPRPVRSIVFGQSGAPTEFGG